MKRKNRLDLSGRRFHELVVLSEADRDKFNHRQWLCRCDCGSLSKHPTSSLTGGNTHSCGCKNARLKSGVKKDIAGCVFGDLTVIDRAPDDTEYYQVKYRCVCKCGRTCIVSYPNLSSGASSKCGDCRNSKNGNVFSKKQKSVCDMLSFSILNYPYKKMNKRMLNIDIAIVHNGEKVAIEYDEWHWHKRSLNKDRQRRSFLIGNGWRVIRICASNNLPTLEQLKSAISSNEQLVEIILPGWGEK
jgi:very-short-patch-repair endonuclease